MSPIVKEVCFYGAWPVPGGVLRIGKQRRDCAVRLAPLHDGVRRVAVFTVGHAHDPLMNVVPRIVDADGAHIEVEPQDHEKMRVVIRGPEVDIRIEAIASALMTARGARRGAVSPDPLATSASDIQTERDRVVNAAISALSPLLIHAMPRV